MERWRVGRLCMVATAVSEGPKSYRQLVKELGMTRSQVDGDRTVLQRQGIVDVTGSGFSTILLKRPLTARDLEELMAR